MTQLKNTIDDNLLKKYHTDGVVCLRNVVPKKWIRLARSGIAANLKNPGPFFRDHTSYNSKSRYLFEYWTWPRTIELKKFIYYSPVGEIAGRLMQAQYVNMVMDNWFIREAGNTDGAPWHHDEPYFDFEGTLCVVWIPLDEIPRHNSLIFVKGSHNWGQLYSAVQFSKNVPFKVKGDRYLPVPDIESNKSDYEFLSWDLAIGDCLVFDFRTLHRVNNSGVPLDITQRRLSLRYGSENVVFKPRGVWTEPTSSHIIKNGQIIESPIDCPLMPKVWTLKNSSTRLSKKTDSDVVGIIKNKNRNNSNYALD